MDTYQKNLRDKWFFYDEDVAIFWDGDRLFQVQNDGKIVDSFEENETIATVEKAEQIADDYMAEKLQEEMLDNADDIEFQFKSPDLFRM
jgi:hypothetical protein